MTHTKSYSATDRPGSTRIVGVHGIIRRGIRAVCTNKKKKLWLSNIEDNSHNRGSQVNSKVNQSAILET